jgi:hypothetical protein
MKEKNKIDELLYGGGILLGIQNQVDDLVTAEAVLERRFDEKSIQDTTLMTVNEAIEEEDNVDADLKWIEQTIYNDDDGNSSHKEQKEQNQYGSCYNFLYQNEKLFEYAGE